MNINQFLLLFLLSVIGTHLHAQCTTEAGCNANTVGAVLSSSGILADEIAQFIDEMPGRSGNYNAYQDPDDCERSLWCQMMHSAMDGNYELAADYAYPIGYEIVAFTDNDYQEIYYLIRRNNGTGNHWGSYLINPNASRPNLIIQSPHPKYDAHTGSLGLHVFQQTGAFLFMLSGTHRCNNLETSECSGTFSFCNDNQAAGIFSGGNHPDDGYRKSDMAHSSTSIYQLTTEILEDQLDQSGYYIQLHGFTSEVGGPDAELSNGTAFDPETDPLKLLALALEDSLDNDIDYIQVHHINAVDHAGTFNTQGRYLNGETTNPCNQNATQTSGRFLHLELDRAIRGLSSTPNLDGWQSLTNAVATVFSPVSFAANPDIPSGSYTTTDCDILFANGQITSYNTANFTAAKTITLTRGFFVESGSVLQAELAPCPAGNRNAGITSESPSKNVPRALYHKDVDSQVLSELSMKVFPNPSRGNQLNLKIDGLDRQIVSTVTLYNSLGQQLQEERLPIGSLELYRLDISRLNSGLHVVQVQIENRTLTQQVLVIR